MVVEIHKLLCRGGKTENLIESTNFGLKISRVHMFCSSFSQVHIFCDDNHSKLAPESIKTGGVQVELLSIT